MGILIFLGQAALLAVVLFIVVFIILFIRNWRLISSLQAKAAKIAHESKFVKIEQIDENMYAMYDAFTDAFLLQAETELQLQQDAYTKFENLVIVK